MLRKLHSKLGCSLSSKFRLQGVTRKGFQSRSATTSLLIKSYMCMKEKMELIVALLRFPFSLIDVRSFLLLA